MTNFFGKDKVKVALNDKRSRFDLSCVNISSLDFWQLRPTYINEVVPGQKLKINLNTFARLSPLQEPFLGDAQVVSRAFFVPHRIVWPQFTEFITDSISHVGGTSKKYSQVRSFKHEVLYDLFAKRFTPALPAQEKLGNWFQSDQFCDFRIEIPGESGLRYGRLTFRGKCFYNILRALGYNINFGNKSDDLNNTQFSALPLLSFCKIFYDWFDNRSYDNANVVENVISNPDLEFTDQIIYNLLDATYRMFYPQDYFTSAFDSPAGPNVSIDPVLISDNTIDPSKNPYSVYSYSSVPTPHAGANMSSSETPRLSDYILKTLHKVQDYFTRKQLSGSRSLERYKTEFGIELSEDKLHRSNMFGKSVTPLYISDVMQTSPDSDSGTSSAYGLGSYAGKGIVTKQGYDNILDYEFKEFGFVIVLSYVQPKYSYFSGRPRFLQHLSRFDFFTPEFDGLGNQAIRMDELIADRRLSSSDDSIKDNAIFGFTPRYAEYKVARDFLGGDFSLRSKNQLLKGWTLSRDFNYDNALTKDNVHNYNFTHTNPLDHQNIFIQEVDPDSSEFFDHFFCHFRFDIESFSPMKPLFDWYDFDSAGREIMTSINGENAVNN